jgi:hypothetical protein
LKQVDNKKCCKACEDWGIQKAVLLAETVLKSCFLTTASQAAAASRAVMDVV